VAPEAGRIHLWQLEDFLKLKADAQWLRV